MNMPELPEESELNQAKDAASSLGAAARDAGERMQEKAEDFWEATKNKSANLMERQMSLAERNPGAAFLEALAIGFVFGVIVRYLLRPTADHDVNVKHKPTIEDTKYHLGSLVLPFLWPLFQKAKHKTAEAADAAHSVYDKVKEVDLGKLGHDSAEHVEHWVNREVAPVVENWWKKMRSVWS